MFWNSRELLLISWPHLIEYYSPWRYIRIDRHHQNPNLRKRFGQQGWKESLCIHYFFSLGWIYWYTLLFMILRFKSYKKIITHLLAKDKISRCQFANREKVTHIYLIFHILQLYNCTLSTSQNTRDSLQHCTIKIQQKKNVLAQRHNTSHKALLQNNKPKDWFH